MAGTPSSDRGVSGLMLLRLDVMKRFASMVRTRVETGEVAQTPASGCRKGSVSREVHQGSNTQAVVRVLFCFLVTFQKEFNETCLRVGIYFDHPHRRASMSMSVTQSRQCTKGPELMRCTMWRPHNASAVADTSQG